MKFNVAIDGPSSAGKSTIAQLVADKYNLIKLDTGAMYRCVAYLANLANLDLNDQNQVMSIFENFDYNPLVSGEIYLNGKLINSEIRNDKVSLLASKISKHKKVREKLVLLQQNMAKELGYILEGRDIGTVVLPDALVKIYLEADPEVRALRRFKEYQANNVDADFKQVLEDIKKRDFEDLNRKESPLKKADDAVVVDASNLSIDEVVLKISEIIDEKLGS